MEAFQVMVGGVISIVFYAVVLGALYKLFQMHTELGEIKELLKDIRRNTEIAAPPGLGLPHSSESLMRAVSGASYEELTQQPEAEPYTAD